MEWNSLVTESLIILTFPWWYFFDVILHIPLYVKTIDDIVNRSESDLRCVYHVFV